MKTDPFDIFRNNEYNVMPKKQINEVLDAQPVTGEQIVFAMRFDNTIQQRQFVSTEQSNMFLEQIRHFKNLAWKHKTPTSPVCMHCDESSCVYCGAEWDHNTQTSPDNVKHYHDCPMNYPPI